MLNFSCIISVLMNNKLLCVYRCMYKLLCNTVIVLCHNKLITFIQDDSLSTQSTSENISQSTFESEGSNICQTTTSSVTAAKDGPCSSKFINTTAADKSKSGHGKLSIKRRRKKKVKFSMEKPAIPESTKQVRTDSQSKVKKVVSTPLAQLTEEKAGTGNVGNENKNIVEKRLLLTDQQECLFGYAERNNLSREESSPVKKKPKIDATMSPVKGKMSSSQRLPVGSQHLGHNVSHILETPAPIQVIEPMDCTDEPLSSVSKSRQQESDSAISQSSQSERRQHRSKSPSITYHPSDSPRSGTTSPVLSQQIPGLSSFVTETPFIRPSELCHSSVRRVMETPFISNIQSMDSDEEQDESILAKETQPNVAESLVPDTALPDKKAHIEMEIEESHLSDSILAKESEDIDAHYQSPHSSQVKLSMDTDESCSVLGPTPVENVPETQFTASATPKPIASQLPQSQSIKITPDNVVACETEDLSKLASISSSSSSHSYQGSPLQQSCGTVCIGETQFTKSGSQDKKCSPSEYTATIMPSPPLSPSVVDIQSPIIPLQNSLRKDLRTGLKQQSPIRKSKINNTTCWEQPIVPSSQPSPFSKRERKSVRLPGLTIQYHQQPQPVVAGIANENPPQDEETETEQQNRITASPQTLDHYSRQSETSVSSEVQSPLKENQNGNVIKCSTESIERVQNDTNGPVALPGSTQKCGFGLNAASIGIAFSNLQSQRDNLLSQISCSADLSSQQLEMLRIEMEAKQREIDELEAALEQVQVEEIHQDALTNTQSSVKSITAIADTLPISNSFTAAASEQQEKNPEQPIESGLECNENQILAVHTSPSSQSSSNSQIQRDEPMGEECVRMTSPTVDETMQTVCDTTSADQVFTSPHRLIEAASELNSRDSSRRIRATKSPPVDILSTQSHTGTDAGDDTVEALSTSQSVDAVLQAADEVLRKLKNPPLAVLEERSSLEIDEDLCSAVSTTSRSNIKAKLQITTMSSVTSRAAADRSGEDQPLPRQAGKKLDKTTLEVESGLCAKEDHTSVRSSTTGAKKLHNSLEKSKKRKKKTSLVLLEQEATQSTGIPSESKSSSSRSIVTESDFKSSPNLTSAGGAIGGKQVSNRVHSRRDSRGDTSPQYHNSAGLLQTPKLLNRQSGSLPIVSPCRPLGTIGKDHPPSYVGSGLSKHQLVSQSIFPTDSVRILARECMSML